jgi:hypothetical protein
LIGSNAAWGKLDPAGAHGRLARAFAGFATLPRMNRRDRDDEPVVCRRDRGPEHDQDQRAQRRVFVPARGLQQG